MLYLVRAHLDDSPAHPPLRGEDPKAAFYCQPGTAEAVVVDAVLSSDVGARERTEQEPVERGRPCLQPGQTAFSHDDLLQGLLHLQGSPGCLK